MSHILRRDQRRISAPASGLSAKSHKGEVPYCYKADAAAGIKQGTSACRGIISPPHAAGICHRLREDGSHTAVKQMASHGESRETVLPAKQIALSIFKSFAYCFGFGAWFYYSRIKARRLYRRRASHFCPQCGQFHGFENGAKIRRPICFWSHRSRKGAWLSGFRRRLFRFPDSK